MQCMICDLRPCRPQLLWASLFAAASLSPVSVVAKATHSRHLPPRTVYPGRHFLHVGVFRAFPSFGKPHFKQAIALKSLLLAYSEA